MEEKQFSDFNFSPFDKKMAESIKKVGCKLIRKKIYPIIDVPANGNPDWYEGAYTLAFVYSKHNGNFILRGYRGEVEKFLKENYTNYFVYISMWSHGQSRGTWHFWKENVGIFEPSKRRKDWKYVVRPYLGGGFLSRFERERVEKEAEKKSLRFKRLPKRWIPEFDQF
jgi:hypothetical protein